MPSGQEALNQTALATVWKATWRLLAWIVGTIAVIVLLIGTADLWLFTWLFERKPRAENRT
jgi:hypothetical protein